MTCAICGCENFIKQEVLWPDLCESWELLPDEIDYINEQQGMRCIGCSCNLRAQVLAKSLVTSTGESLLFNKFYESKTAKDLKILEINTAGDLHPYLKILPEHKLIEYPEYDMMSLDLPNEHFDLVIHSDTLEHVPDPMTGLQECRRVLKKNGICLFTVPIIVGRLSKNRKQMPPSYHGDPADNKSDFLVHSEFGADAWTLPLLAGFEKITIHQIRFHSAIAIEARR